MAHKKQKPTLYSCSGCSSAAQLCNDLAKQLDREGLVNMSCIAGVGAGVTPLVRQAKQAAKIIALDGCRLQCSHHCLAKQDLAADIHLDFSGYGVKKKLHQDYTKEEFDHMYQVIKVKLGTA